MRGKSELKTRRLNVSPTKHFIISTLEKILLKSPHLCIEDLSRPYCWIGPINYSSACFVAQKRSATLDIVAAWSLAKCCLGGSLYVVLATVPLDTR